MVVGGSRRSPGAVRARRRGRAARRRRAARAGGARVHRRPARHRAARGRGVRALPDARPTRSRVASARSSTSADAVLVGPGFDDPDETRATLLAVAEPRPAAWCWTPSRSASCRDVPRDALPADLILNPNEEEAGILLGRELSGRPRRPTCSRSPGASTPSSTATASWPTRTVGLADRGGRPGTRDLGQRRCPGRSDRGLRRARSGAGAGRGLGRVGPRDRRRSAHRADRPRLPRQGAGGGASPLPSSPSERAAAPLADVRLSTALVDHRHPSPRPGRMIAAPERNRHDYTASMRSIAKTAHDVFGWSSLRDGQEEAVSALLTGRDVITVLPTGAGKSAIYQLAGTILEGITVVVSPLIALQRDQLNQLEEAPELQEGLRSTRPSANGRPTRRGAGSRVETRVSCSSPPSSWRRTRSSADCTISAWVCSPSTRRTAWPAGGTTSDRTTCGWATSGPVSAAGRPSR